MGRPGLGRIRSVVLPVGLAALLLLAWQMAVVLGRIPPAILPSPVSTLGYIAEHWDILLTHAVPTPVESVVGFGLATVDLFGAEGARVLVADIQDARGETLVVRLGDAVRYQHCDVTEAPSSRS